MIDAPEAAVQRVLRRTDVWTRTVRALGARAEVAGPATGPRARLRAGDLIRIRRDRAGRRSVLPPRSVILRVDQPPGEVLPRLEFVAGPLQYGSVVVNTAPADGGTTVTVDVQVRAAPAVGTRLLQARVLAAGRLFLGIVTLAAQEAVVVVAGAVIHDGAVLAARLTTRTNLPVNGSCPVGRSSRGDRPTGPGPGVAGGTGAGCSGGGADRRRCRSRRQHRPAVLPGRQQRSARAQRTR